MEVIINWPVTLELRQKLGPFEPQLRDIINTTTSRYRIGRVVIPIDVTPLVNWGTSSDLGHTICEDVPQLTNGVTSMGITTRPMRYLEVVVLMIMNSDNANVSGASASSTSTGGSTSKAGSDPVSQIDFMNMWSVPKVDLDKFDGDPLDFQSFMSLFDESIGNKLSDDQMKLTRLLYYVSGPAKAAIKGCALVGGTEGYKQARDILKSRFGNVHLISQRIVNELKCGGSVSKSYEIQQLADELVVALSSLEKLNRMSEVENQSCIIEILGRCPLTLCNKWKKLALAHRRKHDDYPKFADFVEFIRSNAYDVCDPVYGNETFEPPRAGKKGSSNFVVSETSGKGLESARVMAPSVPRHRQHRRLSNQYHNPVCYVSRITDSSIVSHSNRSNPVPVFRSWRLTSYVIIVCCLDISPVIVVRCHFAVFLIVAGNILNSYT